MHQKRFILLAFAVAVFCFPAFGQQNESPTPASAQAKPAESVTPAKVGTESDLVVATVSGEPITEKQVLTTINILAAQTLIKPEEQKDRNIMLFKGALDNLVTLTLLKAEVRNQKVTVDKARIDQQIQSFETRYGSKEEFEKAMANQGTNEASLRKSIEETWSVQEVLDRAAKDVPVVKDEEIQKFYDNNSEKFLNPDRAHVAQIFLKIDPAATEKQKEEIKTNLESIRADIESKKITFADAAAKFSQDQKSAKAGGDLGFISRGQTSKPLEEAIFNTLPGGLTAVVENPSGYRLIQVIELKPAGKSTLEEARPAIVQYLSQAAKQSAIQKFVQGLKSKAVVETFMTAEEFDKRHPVE
jgi:parvulin-like peptidyl-prolyl isomerase